MKSMISVMCLCLGLAASAIGCGDDEDEGKEDAVNVQTPGADVNVKAIEKPAGEGAAGSAASAPAQR
jgi:hypothetical protein